MNESRWRLSGLMFELALEPFGRDRLPYPLRHKVDGVETAEEYQRLRAQTGAELVGFASQELLDALTVLLEPAVRVEVHGYYGHDFEQVVRVHAGTTGRDATVAVQLPGRTQQYGGDVLLSRTTPQALAGQVVAQLPRCAGGKYRPVTGHRAELDQMQYSRDSLALSNVEQINRIVRRPRSGLGEIGVYPGGAIDSRPTTDGSSFQWMDYLPVDGRYLLDNQAGGEFALTPGPPGEIRRRLEQLIEATHRRTAHTW